MDNLTFLGKNPFYFLIKSKFEEGCITRVFRVDKFVEKMWIRGKVS